MSHPELTPKSNLSKVILTSTGSTGDVTSTLPYGIYSDSADFVSGASDQVAYVYKKLGGDVLDIELTQFGKYKLSVGEFKPVYYAFFDGDVLYDPECAELTGSQNSIEPRIQENTPRLQAQYVFEGRETAILRGNEIASIENVAAHKLGPSVTFPKVLPGHYVAREIQTINDLNGDILYYPDTQAQQLQAYYQQNFFQKYQYMNQEQNACFPKKGLIDSHSQ